MHSENLASRTRLPRSTALGLTALALFLCLGGCTIETRPAPQYAAPPPPPAAAPPPPPPAPAAEPAPPPPQGEVVYESEPPPPPPPLQETPPPPPGPEFVWVNGYHRWNGRGYAWTHGRYERRPHANARWRDAHWEGRGRAHVWVEGRWE